MMNRLPSVSSFTSVLGSSLRFVQNDSQLCVMEQTVIPSKARNLRS